ncbi:ROK family protein [Dyadobacter pollutisoli]|uniref:ROK family protein n=1 Tax=Dyadobacter pollutisoli TaxID=2910158 RepID=A0A9E8N5P9_9BACT|nr:ROK family protein [Dyadobacter pollutisoli]WAC09238.1 ROK family protein [Dyadobacter pollutisoli]
MMSLGVDIGGSHVTASVIDLSAPGKQPLHSVRKSINSFDTALHIVDSISNCIRGILNDGASVAEIGIAFPGPFDYDKGVSTIRNVGGKFEKTFGIHIKQALKDATGLGDTLFRFSNDAHCFAVGAYTRAELSSKRTVFLTLGTGFGSAFMEDGRLTTHHPALPEIGAFYNEPFLASIADDYFATRWFHNAYKRATGRDIADVQELAKMDSDISRNIFKEFGANLGSFLKPWLEKFQCDELVIGGNISKANALFFKSLKVHLSDRVNIIFCDDTEECILTGAAYIAREENSSAKGVASDDNIVEYNVNDLVEKLNGQKTAIIDGNGITSWEAIRHKLHVALSEKGRRVVWYDINACVKSGAEANEMLTEGNQSQFFDEQKIAMLSPDPSADLCIVYGAGAALSNWEGELVHLGLARKAKYSVM